MKSWPITTEVEAPLEGLSTLSTLLQKTRRERWKRVARLIIMTEVEAGLIASTFEFALRSDKGKMR
jgi:hypothetical protein